MNLLISSAAGGRHFAGSLPGRRPSLECRRQATQDLCGAARACWADAKGGVEERVRVGFQPFIQGSSPNKHVDSSFLGYKTRENQVNLSLNGLLRLGYGLDEQVLDAYARRC